jgi:hypothetical protein
MSPHLRLAQPTADVAKDHDRDDDVVERAEYRDELGHEIDRADQPYEQDDERDPDPAGRGSIGHEVPYQAEDVGHEPGELAHSDPPGSMGRPSAEYEVALVDDTGAPVGTGDSGQLLVRGVPGLSLFAGYLHDVGNALARDAHGQTGGVLVYHSLRDRVEGADLMPIIAAIANHEEAEGTAVSPISAAVILADKSDVHRSRVRKAVNVDRDIHDRVNYAAEQSFLRVDSDARTVSLELTIDTTISQVMEYFEIFLGRMQLCRFAAEAIEARFRLVINGQELLA